MAWWDGLTSKQRAFCEAFAANGGNAYQAAIVAGYAHPQQQGHENMEKPGVRMALERLREQATSAAIATREERQSWWSSLMRGEVQDTSTADRIRASELLGKSQADFIERVHNTGTVAVEAIKLSDAELDAEIAASLARLGVTPGGSAK